MCCRRIWKPEVFADNSFGYSRSPSQSLRFRIRQVFEDRRKVDAIIVKDESQWDNLFYAVFDRNDVDFEIGIDNSSGWNVGCEITVGESSFSVYLNDGLKTSMKALESGGKQLHFTSLKTLDGKLLVAMKARLNDTSYQDEEVKSSRIGFRFYVEYEPAEVKKHQAEEDERTVEFLRRHRDRVSGGPPMTIRIKGLTGETWTLQVFKDYTVEMVKLLYQDAVGLPPDQQRLIFQGKQLVDEMILGECGIEHDSTAHLTRRLRGGGVPLDSERGVVCFGGTTDQRCGTYGKEFINSQIHEFQCLKLGLRTQPDFSFAL